MGETIAAAMLAAGHRVFHHSAARLADTVLTIPYCSRGIPGFTVVGTVGVVNGLLAAAATQMSTAQKGRMVKRIEEAEAAQSAWAFWDLSTPEARSR